MERKALFILLAAVLVFGLVSFSEAKDKLRVGMVFDVGGKGDQSFNDSAYRGLQWASKLGVSYVDIEPGADADRETGLRMIAGQGFDLVIGVGFLFTDAIKEVSDEFPDTKFAIVDGYVPDKPNVSSLLFKEHEGSFLVGIIAAMKAKLDGKDTIGFVGGMDVPLIHKFEAGYSAPVQNPKRLCRHDPKSICRSGKRQRACASPDRQGSPRHLSCIGAYGCRCI